MKLKMVAPSESENLPTTRQDFKNILRMFKNNYRAFLLTELFALIALIVVMAGSILLFLGIVSLIPNLSLEQISSEISDRYHLSALFRLGLAAIFGIVFMGFINSQFGLANDIMNSGEMYAEFQGSFTYFKKNWWQYYIGTIIVYGLGGMLGGPVITFPYERNQIFSLLPDSDWVITLFRIILFFLHFGWFVVFIHYFPAVSYHDQVKKAFNETFTIIKKNPTRVLKSWGLYFLCFRLPLFILDILGHYLKGAGYSLLIMQIISVVFYLIIIIFGTPLLTLLATGIYNNSPITKEKINKSTN